MFFHCALPCVTPGNGLRQIWDLVMPSNSVLRNKGLVAIGLQNSVLIWINRKPATLGDITGWLMGGEGERTERGIYANHFFPGRAEVLRHNLTKKHLAVC